MNLINIEFGTEVTVDSEGWDQIIRRGDADKFSKEPTSTYGFGPAKKIALLLHGNGIGDMVHSLPAICAKIAEGYEIDLMAEKNLCPFFERTGCNVIPAYEMAPGGAVCYGDGKPVQGFIKDHRNEYGKFYSLKHWCVAHDEESEGKSHIDRFDQIAGYLDVELPKKFDWKPYLLGGEHGIQGIRDAELPLSSNTGDSEGPDSSRVGGEEHARRVILGVQASSRQREYPNAPKLKAGLTERGIEYAELGRKAGYHGIPSPEAVEIQIKDIPDYIERSEVVVGVDSGILAIALALNKPCVGLFGPTDSGIIANQFYRYHRDLKLTVIKSAKEELCRPCNFQHQRGYGGDRGKCTRIPIAQCMKEIEVERVLDAIGSYL